MIIIQGMNMLNVNNLTVSEEKKYILLLRSKILFLTTRHYAVKYVPIQEPLKYIMTSWFQVDTSYLVILSPLLRPQPPCWSWLLIWCKTPTKGDQSW